MAVLLLTAAGSCHSQYTVYRQDPFALLSGTLQTYQRAACDSQVLNLECPIGTKISIQLVQYGRSLPSAQVGKHLLLFKAKLLACDKGDFTLSISECIFCIDVHFESTYVGRPNQRKHIENAHQCHKHTPKLHIV